MAGRLGARTFYLPLAGIACHGHYTCDLDSYVGLIETEVMLCLFEIEQAWLWAGEQLPCGLLVLPDMLPLCRLVCLPLPK